MSTETIINTILSTSITGASLVLIIYSVAIPHAKNTLHKKAEKELELVRKIFQSIEGMKKKNNELTKRDLRIISSKLDKLSNFEKIPFYLSSTFGYFVFGGFMFSAILSAMWIFNISKTFVERWIALPYSAALIIFFITGIVFIKDFSKNILERYSKIVNDLVWNEK
ncbi:MAG: hypothetical protein KC535_05125 [Nanoarchaeota archaeon]|nr:hypothetical protein [Nanoarchaeota archaeon]